MSHLPLRRHFGAQHARCLAARLLSAFALTPLLGSALLPGPALAGVPSLSRLYVFGDSLSDSGNSKAVSNGAVGATFPPSPYSDGRFSNGLVAAEYLWQAFNPGDTSFRASLQGGTNYAIGGSTTGEENFIEIWDTTPPPLKPAYVNKGNVWQLNQFVTSAPGSFSPETSLFLVWLFPNDTFWFNASGGQSVGHVNATNPPSGLIETAVDNIIDTIDILASYGATNFLVPNSPDLGKIPEFISDLGQSAAFTALSNAFNGSLATALSGLSVSRPELDIETYQIDDLLTDVSANPAAFGFTNTTTRCIVDPACVGGDANAQARYLFWDGSHPTTAGHALIGKSLYGVARDPVPAPLPVAGGLAFLGWSRTLRRRIALRR